MKGNDSLNEYNKHFKQNKLNKNDYNTNNVTLFKSLKEEIEQLENEKNKLQNDITTLRKNVKNMKKDDYTKKIQALENTRNETKKTATHYLHMCSQLAEEVIVLRDQLDKYSHINK